MLGLIKYFLSFLIFRRNFLQRNRHNKTFPKNLFSLDDVKVGSGTYGPLRIVGFGMTGERLTIGSYCSIAQNVEFILGGNHNYKRFSTYPFGVLAGIDDAGNIESSTKGPIVVGDDVWFAYGCKILSGVSIGRGAIISAFAVVTKDVPPYAIVGGVPAKILKYRFTPEIIRALEKLPTMEHLDMDTILGKYSKMKEIESMEDVEDIRMEMFNLK